MTPIDVPDVAASDANNRAIDNRRYRTLFMAYCSEILRKFWRFRRELEKGL